MRTTSSSPPPPASASPGWDYDTDALGALMAARGWITLQLVRRLGRDQFAVRDPFPPGGVYEDPATGAAAAAFGAYLHTLGAVEPGRSGSPSTRATTSADRASCSSTSRPTSPKVSTSAVLRCRSIPQLVRTPQCRALAAVRMPSGS